MTGKEQYLGAERTVFSRTEAVAAVHSISCDNLSARLTEQLRAASARSHDLLNTLCHLAELRQCELFLVGGAVRDLLLQQRLGEEGELDLDFAVDGEPEAFHSVMSEAAGGDVTIHDRFGTASVTLNDGTNVDLARTRSERYPAPAALPIVSAAPIEIDLQRRDFTIHAAALALSGARAGALLDPQGAIADLKHRRIRTLHSESFRDDPTRLVRAARYAARIDGVIERRTMIDARRDRRYLPALSSARFGDAWRLLLQERDAAAALSRARRMRIPQSREPRWSVPSGALAASGEPERFWAAVGLLSREPQIAEWLPESVGMSRPERGALQAGAALRRMRRSLGQMRRASSVALNLKRVPDCALEAAQLGWNGPSQVAVASFLERRASVVSPLTAESIMALGVEPGPRLGRWLERVESAIWDGELDPQDAASVARMEQRIRLSR